MNANIRLTLLGAYLILAATVSATELRTPVREGRIIHGGSTALHKAAGDTIDVMGPGGSGAPYLGDFEAGWNGWTSIDHTQITVTHWQVSDYAQPVAGNLAAWCGDLSFESCDPLDVPGGYGNSWDDLLVYRTTVANTTAGATVAVSATLQYDTEPGYDFVYLSAKVQGDIKFTNLASWDGLDTTAVNDTFTYLPSEYVDGTDIYVLFRFQSDGGWSDADCSFASAGACQVDNITVTTTQTEQTDIINFTDFQDGTFGDWFTEFPAGVGNFAALWSNLKDLDPCSINRSQQVAFIDDGLVVPGTGGTQCIDWCYGPGGYIVNNSGGLVGTGNSIWNDILSPVIPWPNANNDGVIFSFDAYRHETITTDSPLIFFAWHIRSADTDNSAGNGFQIIDEQDFVDNNLVYFGGPEYVRFTNDVSHLMNPGRDEFQVSLSVFESFGWSERGNNGTPAPYFDNISLKVYPFMGPSMTTRESELAQDNFPEVDTIDFGDLGSMHVRFDMAADISPSSHRRNDPGDSIIVDIRPMRAGATLSGAPEIHYVIDPNPVFDTYRTTAISGVVSGLPASDSDWSFDLPDTGTLYPGDVLHYYIRTGDEVGGDVQYATVPADLTGFGDFSDPLAYDNSFVVHALPTIIADGLGGYEVPPILFWNDSGEGNGDVEWHGGFRHVGLVAGLDYDTYYTNAAELGVGNGIGGRTTGPALDHYSELFYTAGDLDRYTISNGDPGSSFNNDQGDDLTALQTWLSAGNKDMFLTGDNVAKDLAYDVGPEGISFLETVMGLDMIADDIRPLIQNQTTPLVLVIPGNPVIQTTGTWIAYGGCKHINTFDAVTPRAGAIRLAEFADPSNDPGAYPYSAATLNVHNTTNRIISLPYDLMSVYTDPNAKTAAPLSGRDMVLQDILNYFGAFSGVPEPSGVPAVEKFAVSNHPNPFNPNTKISYMVDKPADFTLKIYNVRGQLVRTLFDGLVQTSGFVMWDGTDDAGAGVASGVYFREARLGDKVQIGKMALLK